MVAEPTFPGCLIQCRAIALLEMGDEKGPDGKVLTVPAGDPRYEHLRDVTDIPTFELDAIQHFFEEYKVLEGGKAVSGTVWRDRAAAESTIAQARNAFSEHQ
jgi:inorganic pyrophosphatase